jgi:atypical dual specificity phosphatase
MEQAVLGLPEASFDYNDFVQREATIVDCRFESTEHAQGIALSFGLFVTRGVAHESTVEQLCSKHTLRTLCLFGEDDEVDCAAQLLFQRNLKRLARLRRVPQQLWVSWKMSREVREKEKISAQITRAASSSTRLHMALQLCCVERRFFFFFFFFFFSCFPFWFYCFCYSDYLHSLCSSFAQLEDMPNAFPNEIIPGLFLGDCSAARNPALVDVLNVHAIVNAFGGSKNHFQKKRGMEYFVVDIADSPTEDVKKYFKSVGAFIHGNIKQRGVGVLVHCAGNAENSRLSLFFVFNSWTFFLSFSAGVSRSASLVLAYLMEYCNFSLYDAYKFVRERRRVISPNAGFSKQLEEYEKELRKTSSVTLEPSVHTPLDMQLNLQLAIAVADVRAKEAAAAPKDPPLKVQEPLVLYFNSYVAFDANL